MKIALKIAEVLGTEIRTRGSIEQLKETLSVENEYLFDMSGIDMISRSAADELYNVAQIYNVKIVNMTPFIQRMFDAVTIGRFYPRQHIDSDVVFVKCKDIESLRVWSGATH